MACFLQKGVHNNPLYLLLTLYKPANTPSDLTQAQIYKPLIHLKPVRPQANKMLELCVFIKEQTNNVAGINKR